MSHDLTKARRKPGPGHAWGEGQLTPALGHGVLALGQQQQELASPLWAQDTLVVPGVSLLLMVPFHSKNCSS